MVWAILAAVGVPLWLCAAGILTLVFRNRGLRKRSGDVPVRMRRKPGGHWTRGHGVWVHDVFVFRGSPAAWKEDLIWTSALATRSSEQDRPKGLHNLGDDPVIASLSTDDGDIVEFAARTRDAALLSGPFTAQPNGRTALGRATK